MRIVRHFRGLAEAERGAAAAIGNFDGVHRGHIAVIERARVAAGHHGVPLGVVTFEPHPRAFFAPETPPFRLMNAAARAHRLEKLGVELLYELPFDGALAGLEPEAFAAEVLDAGLGLRHVVVGEDFRFGRARRGDVAMLERLGGAHGFTVERAALVADGGTELSSSAIRRALAEGRPADAARMLGHWHRIEGTVAHGDRRGRELGYPTANMALEGLHLPRFGVYAVLVDVLDGPFRGSHVGAASLGIRPMFRQEHPSLETHLLDFAGDLYGATLSVGLVAFLRPEQRFDSLDALVARMAQDCREARAALSAAGVVAA